jgi:metal-sulfur cluster biosynthetic enzyme
MTESEVLVALRDVVDPELGINVVDLGLVYGVEVEKSRVRVIMTMTSRACPLSLYVAEMAETAIRSRDPLLEDVRVDIVWDPPWHPERIAGPARRILGW